MMQQQQQAQKTPPPQGAQQSPAQTPQPIAPAPSQPPSSPMMQQHNMVSPPPVQSPLHQQQHVMAPPPPQPSPHQQQQQQAMGQQQQQAMGQQQQQTMGQQQQAMGQQQQAMGQHNMGPGAPMPQVQLIQNPQNPVYLQQVYNTQSGQQILMPGNLALHPSGMNQPVQVIGKPYQPGQLTPHLMTAQGKPVLQAGQPGSFQGYATIPTSNNQTLVISPMGVLSSQPNMMPGNSSAAGKQEVHKQFQWQFGPSMPPGLTWAQGGSQALLTTPNQIFIRGTQQDGQIFIQNALAQAIANHNQMSPNMTAPPAQMQQQQQKPVRMEMPPNIQPKAVPAGRHHSNILPSSTPGSGPGSSVSTQTIAPGQERVLDQRDYEGNVRMYWKLAGIGAGDMSGAKARSKPGANRAAQGGGAMKVDAANQMKQQQPGSQPTQIMNTISRSILTNNQAGVPNQLPPLVHMQGNMVMAGGDKPMMTSPSPQMMGKLVPVPMQQQMHLVPQQSVQPLQHRMPTPGDKPMMPAAVMQGIPSQGMMISPTMSMHPQMSAMSSPPPTNMVPAGMHLQQGEPQQMATPTMTMVANSMQSDPSFGLQQNVVQPMEVVENSETQNAVAEDKNGEETDDAKDKGKLKALVKPQVMTHMIEGFMILEASEPFTKSRSGMSSQDTASPSLPNHNSDKENQASNESCELATKQPIVEPQASPVSKCEICGKVDPRAKFKKSKRCCSPSCVSSKRMTGPEGVGGKKSTSKQAKQDSQKTPNKPGDGTPAGNGLNPADTCGSASAPESSLSPSKAAAAMNPEDSILPLPSKNSPDKWNVSEVCEFIRLLPGCSEYAEDFAIQEIDGQALMLLKADHLMAAMSMKLGPALKICAKIDQLKSLAAEDK